MVKLWRRYKPFINAGVQELITYRVNFLLYRIGDVMGAFVAFYLWKAVFDSSQESLIQGFSMADITLYIIMRSRMVPLSCACCDQCILRHLISLRSLDPSG